MQCVCVYFFTQRTQFTRTHSSAHNCYVLDIKTKREWDSEANALEQQQQQENDIQQYSNNGNSVLRVLSGS